LLSKHDKPNEHNEPKEHYLLRGVEVNERSIHYKRRTDAYR
jgi:hypothetical protein